MYFNKHPDLLNKHAFLSPSAHHWLRYDDAKLKTVYESQLAKVRGTQLHELGCKCISLKVRLPDDGQTLSMYVNDAIDLGLTPEQPLYYSYNCYGTADTIGIFDGVLHIHDLKSGKIKASFNQLLIYSALFFLEYGALYNPDTLPVELRLYQNDNIDVLQPTSEDIYVIMSKIVHFDNIIQQAKGAQSTWTRDF